MLLCFAVSSITSLADQPSGWEEKHLQLQQQREVVFIQLENIHTSLLSRAKKEDPTLLTRLSLDPPEARATGYGLLPVLKESEPPRSVEPTQTFYSLKWLEERFNAERQNADELQDQLADAPELEDLVIRFEEALKRLRNLEDNLTYHSKWQKAVLEYPAYFQKKNELVAMARELSTLIANNAPASEIAALRHQLLEKSAPFKLTPNLQILTGETGGMVLPVMVCTDIQDPVFLNAFKQGVIEAFNLSSAAQAKRFMVEVNWQPIDPESLYPAGVPPLGEQLDMKAHYDLFTACPLVLTTGASSMNAGVGSRIFLGTRPVSPRTLAHEFGHLLGFEDAYLRGYDGDPADPYGVVIVEWSGLSSDLMGDSKYGQVGAGMIDMLIKAYHRPVPAQ